ncbi:MAG: InlB B-repeat-containing protein [Clostridia bacterium]|nr:InlB B-repeat-containing protein [Clostridia bacterium]
MKKLVYLTLLVCLVCILATSCVGMKFDISFIVDNENYGRITTDGNEQIAMPENPQKDGYVFKGWYWDKGIWEKPFTANSLMDAPLSSDLSVYAYFVLEGEDTANEQSNKVTLTFNTMGGSNIKSQTLNKGETSIEPAAPEKEGYYFSGWYTYPDYENEFSFDKPLTSSTTVYAKWTQITGSQLFVNDYQDIVSTVKDVSFHDILRDENGKYYVVYKIGEIRNAIVHKASGNFVNYGGTSITWERITGWESSFTESVERSVSMGLTTSLEVGVGMVKGTVSLSTELSESVSYSQTESVMEQVAVGGSQELDGFELGRQYAMFVVSNQNVYQYFVYDEKGRLENTAIATSEISSTKMVLSSPDGVFDYNKISKLDTMDAPNFSMIFNAGAGTESDPYCIENPTQLFAAGFCPDANYKLTKDIDLFKYKVWNPIGVSTERPFSGSFDGNGKTVKNLKLAYDGKALSDEKVYGLFGYVTGSIKNLNINGITIDIKENNSGAGWARVGALCAKLLGTVENVKAADCHIKTLRHVSCSGIVAGYAKGIIRNTEVKSSSIYSSGDGGLIAGNISQSTLHDSSVSDCELTYIARNTNRSNGGIAGYVYASNLKNCSVSNTKFIFAGSSDNLHSYHWLTGGHDGCMFQPAMGYIAGVCSTSEINQDTLQSTGNSISYKCHSADTDLLTRDSHESQKWFRKYDKKIGFVE